MEGRGGDVILGAVYVITEDHYGWVLVTCGVYGIPDLKHHPSENTINSGSTCIAATAS